MNTHPDQPVSDSYNEAPHAELFKPLVLGSGAAEKISRPSLTYWQDAMRRLRKNRLATFCLGIVVFVGCVGFFGPLFFPSMPDNISYENYQNPDAITQNPHFGMPVVVTDDAPESQADKIKDPFTSGPLLSDPTQISKVENFKVLPNSDVNGVVLEWEPKQGISGYYIFRTVTSEGADATSFDEIAVNAELRGIQLAQITNPAQYTFVDSAGLDASEEYLYSILPFVTSTQDSAEILADKATVVSAKLSKSIKLSEALVLDPEAKVGSTIMSRWSPFGTDRLGRDIFSRMVQGTRIDFFLAFVIPVISLIVGLLYGSISGLVGGKVDLLMMRVVEILDSLPELLFLILFQVVLGKGILSLIIGLAAFSWIGYARVLRGEVLRLREIEFVHASRLLGGGLFHIILRHISPNLLGIIIVLWSAQIPRVIVAEAFLSLLGLGLEAPAASWGTVLEETAQRFQATPIQFFLPAGVMAFALLAFFLLGDALRDAFDPKLRGRE